MNIITEKKVPAEIRYILTLDLNESEATQLMSDLRESSKHSGQAMQVRNRLYSMGIRDNG